MAKLPLTRKGLILFVGWFVVVIIILAIAYLRMEQAKTNLAEYENARSCPTQENCRQKIRATILQSGVLTVSFLGMPIYYIVPAKESTYSILVSSPLTGNEAVKISSDPPYNGTSFDVGQIYIPSGLDKNFVEENLYAYRLIYVEVWQNKITLLSLNGIIDHPYNVIQSTPEFSASTDEVALPTTLHPVFQETQAEGIFYGLGAICIFLSVMLSQFPVLFGLDMNTIWHSAINKREGSGKPHIGKKHGKSN
jgi:hypothetical protein